MTPMKADSESDEDYDEPKFESEVAPLTMGVATNKKRTRKANEKAQELQSRELSSKTFETVLQMQEQFRNEEKRKAPKRPGRLI